MNIKSGFLWGTPKGFAIIGLIGIVGYFLFIEHREHIVDSLPYLLLGACLLMHVFMHRGRGHSTRPDDAESEMRRNEYRRGFEDGKNKARIQTRRESNDAGR